MPMWTLARWARSASLAIVLAFCVALAGVGQGEAREFEIDGIADCGLRNDRRCDFDVSDGRVTVNSGGAQLDSFSVPGGAAGLDVWRVVNFTIDTAGNVNLTPVQSFEAGFATTPFLVPSESSPAPTTR